MAPPVPRLEREAVRLAHSYGMRIVGPNCFGVLNTDPAVSMNATFAKDTPTSGRLGFASQSGGLGIAILAEAKKRGIGLSSFVSMGNKADVSGNDLLSWWGEDEATGVALLYLESFGNPRKFARLARQFGRSKPVVAVKAGRTAVGRRAASSHTAALASSDEAVAALFHQTGVIRVDTIEELFDVAQVVGSQPLGKGLRVAVLSNAGGPAVLAVDACVSNGLQVPEFSAELKSRIADLCPRNGGVSNPIDLGAEASAPMYEQVLDLLLACGEVDAVAVNFTPPLVTRKTDDVAAAIAAAVDRAGASAGAVGGLWGQAGRGQPPGCRRERPGRPTLRSLSRAQFHLSRDSCAGTGSCVALWRMARPAGRGRARPRERRYQRGAPTPAARAKGQPRRGRRSNCVGLGHRCCEPWTSSLPLAYR